MPHTLPSVLHFTHSLLRQQLREGDSALDGTAGNGHDTLLLAQCVGQSGRVYAFDIQQAALDATACRLREAGIGADTVSLICCSHEYLERHVPAGIRAAVFNFGYLPRGDKNITTTAEGSLKAARSALGLLSEGGLLLMVLYSGHPAGKAETAALSQWAAALPQTHYRVLHYGFSNWQNHPPVLLAVEKTAAQAA